MVKRLKVCVGCLLQTDPQERAKTTTASSDCRPRPTAPDPVASRGNSQMLAKVSLSGACDVQPKHDDDDDAWFLMGKRQLRPTT